MTVARVAYVLLSLCCAAKSDEFAASTATCSSPNCIADDGAHALELLQKTMEVDSQQVKPSHEDVEDASHTEDTLSKGEAHMIEKMNAKDELITFLKTNIAFWRDRAMLAVPHCAHDLKLLQKTTHVTSQQAKPSHVVEDASRTKDTHMIEQMKAKDETLEFLKMSVAYWQNRASSGCSEVEQ